MKWRKPGSVMQDGPPWSITVVTPESHADHVRVQSEAAGDVLINVRVGVDHARQHELAGHIDHLGRA